MHHLVACQASAGLGSSALVGRHLRSFLTASTAAWVCVGQYGEAKLGSALARNKSAKRLALTFLEVLEWAKLRRLGEPPNETTGSPTPKNSRSWMPGRGEPKSERSETRDGQGVAERRSAQSCDGTVGNKLATAREAR